MSQTYAVTLTDAIAIGLITSSMIKGGDDPRWYVRHGWIVGAALLFAGRYVEDQLLAQVAKQLADANGGTLPAGYEMFQPYLPDGYTGVAKPAATPTTPALPPARAPGVTL